MLVLLRLELKKLLHDMWYGLKKAGFLLQRGPPPLGELVEGAPAHLEDTLEILLG